MRSKTDQEGWGRMVGRRSARAALCPVRALQAWLAAAGIVEGAVFREVTRHGAVGETAPNDRSVARLVKPPAAGLDAAAPFAGHSRRAGLSTAAAKAGKTDRAIMRQIGHPSVAIVRRYIREAEVFGDDAAEGLL
jgi:integrase